MKRVKRPSRPVDDAREVAGDARRARSRRADHEADLLLDLVEQLQSGSAAPGRSHLLSER